MSGHNKAEDGKQTVAVIGSGISGLSAAWLLSKSMHVTLYEKLERLGGHSNTVVIPQSREEKEIAVDTGFIVYNELNYPNLVALFAEIGVKTEASDMSFAVSLNEGQNEYSGSGLDGLFGQRRNLIKPRFWCMLRDILRFYKVTPLLLKNGQTDGLTLGDYLDHNGYSQSFINDHLLPMGAAIWSTSAREMRDYPLTAFLRFFVSHGLLNLKDRPQWRTVSGGSKEYVKRLLADISGPVKTEAEVVKVTRENDGVIVHDSLGQSARFSHVVIASHADEALRLLGDASDDERSLLGAFGYTDNDAWLHRDVSLMPKRQRVWASWNYLGNRTEHEQSLCVTYWMNKLQNLNQTGPLFVTLNPIKEIAEDKVIQKIHYKHPRFDPAALAAQQQLWRLQGQRNTWFCGAYFGYGFHEDGLQSGLAVAEEISGQKRPWRVADESGRITLRPPQEKRP